MHLFLLVVASGAAAGYLRGGRLSRLAEIRFRAGPLLVLGLAGQLSLGFIPEPDRLPILLATYAVVGVWIARNLALWRRSLRLAMFLMAAGWALNVAAILPHGGMPVSATALDAMGAPSGYQVDDGHLYKHVPGSNWLGDSIPLTPLRAAISVGDVLLAGGIAAFVASAMITPAGSRSEGARAGAH